MSADEFRRLALSLPEAAEAFSERAATETVGGTLFSGMSKIVVTPPAAAARVALSKPSQPVRPGSLTWTWVSTSPGITTKSPKSRSSPPLGIPASAGSTSRIVPSRTTIDAGPTSRAVTTRRLRTIRSAPLNSVIQFRP